METEMEREFSEPANEVWRAWMTPLEMWQAEWARRCMELTQRVLSEHSEMWRAEMTRAERARRYMELLQRVVSEYREMGAFEDMGEWVFEDLKMGQREMVVSEDRKMGHFEALGENVSEYPKMTRPQMMVSEDRKKGVFEDQDLVMGMWVFDNKPESQASSSKITILNDSQEAADLEMGFTPGEIQPRQVPPNSGFWNYLSWATKAKGFKPHQPGPSENAEPEPELEPPHDDDYGEVKEANGLSKVTLATQMVLPAAVGWGGYFVIGQGALYNSAFAFSVFGLHILGILSMFLGWYLGTKTPRVSERMQILGQALCIACLILTQIPVSNKLK